MIFFVVSLYSQVQELKSNNKWITFRNIKVPSAQFVQFDLQEICLSVCNPPPPELSAKSYFCFIFFSFRSCQPKLIFSFFLERFYYNNLNIFIFIYFLTFLYLQSINIKGIKRIGIDLYYERFVPRKIKKNQVS